jgi:tetratricopeptide (TPR) repeat protein
MSSEELGRAMARLERMLLGLVVILTALLALFPIRNSDFWFHLATARDWLAGRFHLGEDPYSYTAAGWVNHSWLYDVLVYALFQAFGALGGPAVIVVKAALLLGLVVLMLSIRRRGQGLWLPGVCTALAVLAMSPAFVMQPAIVSLLFLGVTLALLMRRDLREEPAVDRKHHAAPPVPWLGEPADRPLWLLVPLFALWVNLDAWFFLGPMAVLLYLAGSLLEAFPAREAPNAPRPGAWRPLAAVLAAGVAACLLSPFHVNGLNLPGEIGARGVLGALGGDDRFARLLGSPLQVEYFRSEIGSSVAGLAYFPLVLIGLASFLLPAGRVRWGRVALWGGFFVLSVAHARAIPFFAVVAGPIAALSFQEFAARRWGTTPVAVGWLKQWSLIGRGLSVLVVFLLALLAWPGWLFALPWEGRSEVAEARRVGLAAFPPAGPVRLASQLDEWQRDGTLTDNDRGLNLEPDVNAALTWLCKDYRPKSFFDDRFENYTPEVAAEYVELRRVFEPADDDAAVKSLADDQDRWRPVLAKHGVTYIIASDGARGGYLAVRSRCAGLDGSPALVTLFEDGHAAVFAPREKSLPGHHNEYLAEVRTRLRARGIILEPLPPPPGDTGRFKGKEFNAWALAYGPNAERLPEQKPQRAQPYPWYTRFAFGPGAPPSAAADAAAYRAAAEDGAFRHHYEEVMLPTASRNFAALVGVGAARTGNPLADAWKVALPVSWTLQRQPPPMEVDEKGPVFIGPSAPLMLAVRSARRAILENPQEAEGYFQLGLAYLALGRQSDEHRLGARMQLLGEVRQVETVAALRTAAQLDPDHVGAHAYLFLLYGAAGYSDLQLKHLSEEIRAIRRAGPRTASELKAFMDRYMGARQRVNPANAADAMKGFEDRLKAMEEQRDKLEKEVKEHLNTYAVRAEKKSVLEKAQIALQLGLGEKALQVLLDSTALEFGPRGAQLQLELLMRQGRLDDLREQLTPEDQKVREELPDQINASMGAGAYERYRMLLALAEGDYKEADAALEKAAGKLLTGPELLRDMRLEVSRPATLLSVPVQPSQVLKDEGPVTELTFRQLAALEVVKAIAERPTTPAPVMLLLLEQLARIKRAQLLGQVGGPLAGVCDYEALRGILKLETGDVEGAKKHLRQALYFHDDQADLGAPVVLDFPGGFLAYQYLREVEKKE